MRRQATGTEGEYAQQPVTREEHHALFPNRRYVICANGKRTQPTAFRADAFEVARDLSIETGREIMVEVFDEGEPVGKFFLRDGLMRDTRGDFR